MTARMLLSITTGFAAVGMLAATVAGAGDDAMTGGPFTIQGALVDDDASVGGGFVLHGALIPGVAVESESTSPDRAGDAGLQVADRSSESSGRLDVQTVDRDGRLTSIAGLDLTIDDDQLPTLTSMDLDGDGRLDLVAKAPGTGSLTAFLGRRDGRFDFVADVDPVALDRADDDARRTTVVHDGPERADDEADRPGDPRDSRTLARLAEGVRRVVEGERRSEDDSDRPRSDDRVADQTIVEFGDFDGDGAIDAAIGDVESGGVVVLTDSAGG